jgi:hypothetical protein
VNSTVPEMPAPVVERIHDAAGSYQVGIGLFLLRWKRLLLQQLVTEWFPDDDARDDAHVAQLVDATRHSLDVTAAFLDGSSDGAAHTISADHHEAVLTSLLHSLLASEELPLSVQYILGDGVPLTTVAETLARARTAQLRDYVSDLRKRLASLESAVRLEADSVNFKRELRRDALRRFLDCLFSPFFFLSYGGQDQTLLITWIPTAKLHRSLFWASEKSRRGDSVTLYPSLLHIPDDAKAVNDLSRHLPMLRRSNVGRSSALNLVREMQQTPQQTCYIDNLIETPSPAVLADLHYLNIATVWTPVQGPDVCDAPKSRFGGLLHLCAPLQGVSPLWLAPECNCETDIQTAATRAGVRMQAAWNSVGGVAFVEELQRGLEEFVIKPSARITEEVDRERSQHIQSQVGITHFIKNAATDLMTLASSVRDALSDLYLAEDHETIQGLVDKAQSRWKLVLAQIELFASAAQFAHQPGEYGGSEGYLPDGDIDRFVDSAFHLSYLLLRAKLAGSPLKNGRPIEVALADAAERTQSLALQTLCESVDHNGAPDDWPSLLRDAVRHRLYAPLLVAMAEAIGNVRAAPVRPDYDEATRRIQLNFRKLTAEPGARGVYLLSQHQDGVTAAAIADLQKLGLPNGLETHNGKFGRSGFGILEVDLASDGLLDRLGLDRSDAARGELRYHLIFRFGVDAETPR